MKKHQAGHEREAEKPLSIAPMMIEVQVRQPHRDCPVYSWDHERECLRVMDKYHAEPGLPADLASARFQGKRWLKREDEERPVAWRAIEGLAEALRQELQRDALLQDSKTGPHSQAEHLIRFVPQRFQKALADLLLDDERLLAF